ncbi:MAG: flagellar hook-length control protein FliK [Lachnospiraceae bacterium]|nr:flagellar hook-length control protein FliK [Lachnospiraceae bacterium]
MQISDLLIQYQNNLAAGSEVSTGTKGIEQLVETAKQLQIGNIFEGTVNSIKGSQVILGLSSGQNITARLDKGIVLDKGQSVFFQVKSNDGEQVQIKPISLGGSSGNPTLMNALDAANLPINEKNLNMVNAMMREQMSIGAKSLQDMSRIVLQTKVSDPASVVEMTKLGIPITEENVMQFQNYKADAGEVLTQMNRLVAQIPEAVTSLEVPLEEGLELNQQVISFFAGEEVTGAVAGNQGEGIPSPEAFLGGEEPSVDLSGIPQGKVLLQGTEAEAFLDVFPKDTLGGVLSRDGFVELTEKLQDIPQFLREYPQYFTETGSLSPNTTVKQFLIDLSRFFQNHKEMIPRETISSLLNHRSYKNLLSNLITDQWTIEPEKLTEEHSVRDLYRKMESQLSQLQEIVAKYPKVSETVAGAAKDLSSNISFMNQINQAYHYVQIPFRLQGQNVNSELFVYRNHKEQRDDNEELSAFLHFDMALLGGMDISVKMLHKDVDMHWYLEKEETFMLLSDNLHLLSEKLEQKGYHCDMKVDNETKKVNFVEDFLKADGPTAGQLHRYSFDVRA